MVKRINNTRWQEAQIAERLQHKGSLDDQLEHYRSSYHQYFTWLDIPAKDLCQKTIMEVGPADIPALAFCKNYSDRSVIVEPMPSDHLEIITHAMPVTIINMPAEIIVTAGGQPNMDEIWLFNLLQHVMDPNRVVEVCKDCLVPGGVIRFFEPINTEIDTCHPHSMTQQDYIEWFGDAVRIYSPPVAVRDFHTHPCAYGVWENLKTNGSNV